MIGGLLASPHFFRRFLVILRDLPSHFVIFFPSIGRVLSAFPFGWRGRVAVLFTGAGGKHCCPYARVCDSFFFLRAQLSTTTFFPFPRDSTYTYIFYIYICTFWVQIQSAVVGFGVWFPLRSHRVQGKCLFFLFFFRWIARIRRIQLCTAKLL